MYIQRKNNSIMKKLVILLFSILISFNSHGEGFFTNLLDSFSSSSNKTKWTKLYTDSAGDSVYIQKSSISKRNDGYVYYWEMTDHLKPFMGTMSSLLYTEGDCVAKRYKYLKNIQYSRSMGTGSELVNYTFDNTLKWSYTPNKVLNYVCN
jgi:hypothetical protein